PFVVESEGPRFDELLPGLGNPSVAIPAADKPLYHALCVAAGNLTTLLWQRFFAELEGRWGIDPELVAPYLRQTAANLQSADRQRALTGPIARADRETIDRNVEALDAAHLDDLAQIYRVFVDSTQPVARETAA
ncbi:MAG: DUF2520 domain-containing protein, partial [Acidobacteria bacterium]|nr:DUF2520 domain-containing protein [Acidobacteriota bacterium]